MLLSQQNRAAVDKCQFPLPVSRWLVFWGAGTGEMQSTASPEGSCFSNYLLVLGEARKKMESGGREEAGKAIGRGWVVEN